MAASARAGLIFRAALLAIAALAEESEKLEEEDQGEEQMNFGISVMLLIVVAFVMMLFFLVNCWDKDIKKYSWNVISSTISIFCAVLLFQGINEVIQTQLGISEESHARTLLIVSFSQVLAWFLIMQIFLALVSGALDECWKKKRGDEEEGEEEDIGETRALWLKAWATLLGHITGFASINAFAVLQQQYPPGFQGLWIFVVVLLSWIATGLLGMVTERFRKCIAEADDGVVDKMEEKWSDMTEETENDVIALTVSFILCQWIRYALTGILANPEGEEEPEQLGSHSMLHDVGGLLLCGFVLAAFESFRLIYFPQKFDSEQANRIRTNSRDISMMFLSWCLFFGCTWAVSILLPEEKGMLKQIIIAGMVTAVGIIGIFILDKIADLECTGPQVDQIVRNLAMAFGILVGFAWEKAFDFAVEETADGLHASAKIRLDLGKLLMSVVLAGIVIPNWAMFMLPIIVQFEKEDEEMDEFGRATGLSESDVDKIRNWNKETRKQIMEGWPIWTLEQKHSIKEGGPIPENPLHQPLLVEQKIAAKKKENKNLEKSVIEKQEKIGNLLEGSNEISGDSKRAMDLEKRNHELEMNLHKVVQEIHELRALAGGSSKVGHAA